MITPSAEHAIKNALTVIKAYTQVLEKRLEKTAGKKSLSYLAKISAQVDKLTEILRKGENHGKGKKR